MERHVGLDTSSWAPFEIRQAELQEVVTVWVDFHKIGTFEFDESDHGWLIVRTFEPDGTPGDVLKTRCDGRWEVFEGGRRFMTLREGVLTLLGAM